MCVGSVCAQPPYNAKNPPSGFLLIYSNLTPFSNQTILSFLSVWHHTDEDGSHESFFGVKSLREGLGREGWGKQSSFAFKAECNNMACSEKSCFWQGKKGIVLHFHWEILTNVCYRLFIINHINLGIRWPL